jgi:hypothetical protein
MLQNTSIQLGNWNKYKYTWKANDVDEMNKIYRTVNPRKVTYNIPTITDVHTRIQ